MKPSFFRHPSHHHRSVQTFFWTLVAVASATFAQGGSATPEEPQVAPAGVNAKRLQSAVRWARDHGSSAFLLQVNGRVVADHTWEVDTSDLLRRQQIAYSRLSRDATADGQPVEDVASVQKSVVAILVAMAEERGHLGLDDPVHEHLGPGWSRASRDHEEKVRVRHLLAMSSGLDNRLQREAAPGETWFYNTPAYQLLHRVLREATGKPSNRLLQDWLAKPLGLTHSSFEPRRNPRRPDQLGLVTTARDLLRIGELVLRDGTLDGQRLVDARRLSRLLAPSQTLNPSYGSLWWLNGQDSGTLPRGKQFTGSIYPSAPDDLVMALGALDRHLAISKEYGLVMVRLGAPVSGPGSEQIFDTLWRRIMAALEIRSDSR